MPVKSDMTEAKIELLIRNPGPDGEGFTIREITSGQVYAGYRPKRIDGSGFDTSREVSPVDGRSYFILKSKSSSKYLSLSEREHYLWGLMDGGRSIKDIATAYFFEFGSLDFEAIKRLLTRLREAGLVEFVPASRLRVALDRSNRSWANKIRSRLERIDYRISDADAWVEHIYSLGGRYLVSVWAMALYVMVSVAGISAFGRLEDFGRFPYHLFFEHPLAAVAVVLLSFYPIAAVHELFHALACKRFGRKVHGFGFTLWDGFYPSFYTDVSDIYLSSRSERIYVSLAGPLSTTAIAAVFLAPAALSPGAPWAETLYEIGRLNLLIALVTLYPFQFLKMDGYYLMVDVLGFPGLRERTFAFLAELPKRLKTGAGLAKPELIMIAYFISSAASLAFFVAYFFEAY
jgi:hypothetical protein